MTIKAIFLSDHKSEKCSTYVEMPITLLFITLAPLNASAENV